ncbi:MAG: RHS repeat-associated core domain-containing protein [Ignavibacteriales bacterium]|nr:RHS repeat-associated core domain-containing protein [Ignavibacteriales bacterium]
MFTYDHRNLPLQMSTPQGMVKYRYDESGNRIEKIKGGVTERYIRDHTGREMALHSSTEGYKYFNLFGTVSIGRVDVGSRDAIWIDPETNEEIMVKLRVDNRRYYVQDSQRDKHLGSNRVTIDTTGTVLNAQDYYAFGEILRSYNNSSPNERYYFTGKERDTETNLDYFGARYYDSELGRWLNVDPLADKYPEWSGYNYCMNNPVNVIDPDGRDSVSAKASNAAKGAKTGNNQEYKVRKAKGGSTTVEIANTKSGRVKNGKPVGEPAVRVDGAHGYVKNPHLNVNIPGQIDPHTPLSTPAFESLSKTGRFIDGASKVATPIAVAIDAYRIGSALQMDGGQAGANTISTVGSVAGGWAGAVAGAGTGAELGAAIGTGLCPGVGTAVGGVVGGLVGGFAGAYAGSNLGERIANDLMEP